MKKKKFIKKLGADPTKSSLEKLQNLFETRKQKVHINLCITHCY